MNFKKYVKYIPFLNQPYEKFNPSIGEVANENQYPSQSESLMVSNMISNGTFEYYNGNKEDKGWTFTKKINEEQDTNLVSGILYNDGYEKSKGAFVKDGGIIRQDIDSVYSSFNYNFDFDAKGKGNITLSYYGNSTIDRIGQDSFDINNNEYAHFSKKIKIPEGTKSIRILISTENGNTLYFDNMSMVK